MAKIAGKKALRNEKSLHCFLQKLELEKFRSSKLTLREVLNIGSEICKTIKPHALKNVPWFFLQRLIGLIGTARSLILQETGHANDDQEFNVDDLFGNIDSASDSVNPLDVVCALLHCSDKFLQQEIVRKMSMCQFAVPLILPAEDASSGCILLLWAMRDIVKTWRPKNLTDKKGFVEKNIVHLPLTTFSFVRLGNYTSSKSHTLNKILSSEEQLHDFFVHKNMCGGNIQRKISDGLVEIACYFPGGGDSDLFADPIAIANLRGDLLDHKKQFSFLAKVSTIVFIFIENTDACSHCFTDIDVSNKNLFFIINLQNSKITDTKFKTFLENVSTAKTSNYLFTVCNDATGQINSKYLATLFSDLKGRILVQTQDRQLAKRLQLLIKDHAPASKNRNTLEEFSPIACDLGMDVDENCKECTNPKALACGITQNIKDETNHKNKTFKLQGHFWKELTKNEKELCRMRKQGNMNGEEYKSKINKKIQDLHRQQYQQEIPDGMKKFIAAFTELRQTELLYFLKWMKFYLATVPINNKLQPNDNEIMNQNVSGSHIGVEHFIRELGQLYEAECFLVKNGDIDKSQTKFQNLPGIAADLLLNGFPLELIDGDVSNIPLQWITEILSELDNKTQGKCKMITISVLGVQSSGKSTLLNTMFGLQFPVASGRCTRGAFINLLKVEDELQEQLGCHYILVIDTEGLKAPELASLDDSSEHDNELATLVVGLSDITIVNLSMENAVEMKEILQIVVHAFLRMKHIGKKPNCQFVHQNVGDVSAHDKIMREKKLLMEQLDEMARVAAKMENNMDIKKFSDIIEHDVEAHNWYIPSLWHGVPPMASISTGYSENIFKFKMCLLNFLKQKSHCKANNTKEFVDWIKSLWNAVKHEKFIFSFRSTLVADAYNQLCIAYSNMEWNFRKQAYNWRIKAENEIKNRITDETVYEIPKDLRDEMYQMLQKQENIIIQLLEEYFESENRHSRLVEKYKGDFLRSASLLKNELEDNLNEKCKEVIHIQTGKIRIKAIQATFHEKISEQGSTLLHKYRHAEQKLSENDLESEFEIMWNRILQTLNLSSLKKQDIGKLMLEHLRRDMKNKASYINEKLVKLDSLKKYCSKDFKIKDKHLEGTTFAIRAKLFSSQFHTEAKAIALKVLDRCRRHVTKIINTKEDYNETFCQQLLEIICEGLREKDVQKMNFKPLFELDLKLLALGKAAPIFQKMHENFIRENDPKLCLEKLKPNYLDVFKLVVVEKDDYKSRAHKFCKMCLTPALSQYVLSDLGNRIVDDILNSKDSIKYGSRTFFQTALLKDLLAKNIFDEYVKYCLEYEIFVKDWITKYITARYTNSGILKFISLSLAAITTKVSKALEQDFLLKHTELSKGLNDFCKILKNDLVISREYINVITFENKVNAGQFFQYIKSFLGDIEGQIKKELTCLNIEVLLSMITVQPQDELFKKVFGCGRQCPFCKVPCEAGGTGHGEHFASIHRPQGLGTYRDEETNILCHELCSTEVVSNHTFECTETNWKPHPYKDYRAFFPDWNIQPDPSIKASVYWKYIFKEFNKKFAEEHDALPAELPEDWYKITKERALESLENK